MVSCTLMRSKILVTIRARLDNYLILYGSSNYIHMKGTQLATRNNLDSSTAVQ